MGIIVGCIVSVRETDNVLADGQYGFRKNKGFEAPTLQVMNALEEAEEAGTGIHGSSWDIIFQMSWQRLGVPRHIAKYIVDLDKECLTIPLTPHAIRIMSHNGFSSFYLRPSSYYTASGCYPETGTHQGDTPSLANWNAALDVLLRALHDIDPTIFLDCFFCSFFTTFFISRIVFFQGDNLTIKPIINMAQINHQRLAVADSSLPGAGQGLFTLSSVDTEEVLCK